MADPAAPPPSVEEQVEVFLADAPRDGQTPGLDEDWVRALLSRLLGQQTEQAATIQRLENELRSIDAVLARRPALDKPTRRENIEHAINTAGRMTDRASTLEDAAFHFQTCRTCAEDGEDACISGRKFAEFLRR